MSVTVKPYLSEKDGGKYSDVSKEFIMISSRGLEASILTYGALIKNLIIPDKEGVKADIMLGVKGLDEYMASGSNHGSIVGRSANRISGAGFVIDGVRYDIPANDGPNNLHTGKPAYQNVFWNGSIISEEETRAFISDSGIGKMPSPEGEAVKLEYTSPDGSCGFPGDLQTTVIYSWTTDDTLLILYKGLSNKKTVFAPTNHAYFNLAGHNNGYIGDNILTVYADKVNHKDVYNCPDGPYIDVEGTIFDFRNGAPVKQALTLDNDQTHDALGLDQNFCVGDGTGDYQKVAELRDNYSSRVMEVYTDMPGIQLYAGNHLGGNDQKGDIPYVKYGGLCLEAQMYPNAVNIPEFESPLIEAGVPKYHVCGYRFV